MEWHKKSSTQVLQILGSSKNGLSDEQAAERQRTDGKNELIQEKKETIVKKFLKQLSDPMIIVLLVASVLSAITAIYSGDSFTDVFIILFVVILNSVLGGLQESKAEKALEALKSMAAAKSKVVRNGTLSVIKSEDLVKGDIIHLEAGDAVPADARIIECSSLKAEESALTGESVAVSKTSDVLTGDKIGLGDRKNMLYMGSTIAYGRAVAVVCTTGMDTEMGKIASAIKNAKEESTPLQQKLNSLSKILTWIVGIICVLVFVAGVIKAQTFSLDVVLNTFMLAISLAVAAIPEGLAAVVTIILSIGVTKMSRHNAIIRKLTAVETLGCAQIICSDKTGTLTQNKMTVVETEAADNKLLARAMCLCTDAELDEKEKKAVGEPTECALVNYAYTLGINKNIQKKQFPRVGEAPFDSGRKMMSTIHSAPKGFVQYTKGAPDEILKRCKYILTENGREELTPEKIEKVKIQNKNKADRALRVLACACRAYAKKPENYSPDVLEKDMTFIGLQAMKDPIRPEVKLAVEKCKRAGIRPIMITGDHIDTAVAIAKEIGIISMYSQAITGHELDDMSDKELQENITKYGVYARVQPEHKVRIVSAWKAIGKITAMTGDGVNDAPSIKTADIGIGMGITGTDVTKNVADMILADDNFATIVSAVEEGRKIYANIRKSIQFLLSSNLSEVVSIFVATIVGFTILNPVHLLWINLITDTFPALALGLEPEEKNSMLKKPRSSKDGIFSGGVGIDIIYQGIMISVLTLLAFAVGNFMETGNFSFTNSSDGMTMAFLTMSMAEIFHSFNLRTQTESIFQCPKQNMYLWGSMIAALLLTTAVLYIPFLSAAFGFASISFAEYVVAMAMAVSVIPIVELVKLLRRRCQNKG